jgi:large subunit ribosomal protein L28e
MSQSDALVWSIVRKNNCFVKKQRGNMNKGNHAHGFEFSSEPGNLTNINSFKYSGLANAKAIDISLKASEKFGLKVNYSAKSGKNWNKPNKSFAYNQNLDKGFNKCCKSIVAQGVNTYYRADLKAAALARFTQLNNVVKVQNGIKKGAKARTGRN